MNTPRNSFRILTLALLGGTALMLAACQTAGTGPASESKQIDAVLQKAADQSDAAGPTKDSLPLVEKLYKRNPNDPAIATRYSRALRDAGRLSRASIVISPFARDERKPSAAARTEFASVQTALGNYAVAEEFARKALAMDKQSPESWHILGIALDAQGKHPEAEDAFRKGIDLWYGNPSPILNNLGLNLAAQGFLDEAADVLRKALETSPNRDEIERNLRIVSALRESGGRAPSYMQEARNKKNEASAKKTDGSSSEKQEPKVLAAPVTEVEAVKAPAPVPVPSHKPGFGLVNP